MNFSLSSDGPRTPKSILASRRFRLFNLRKKSVTFSETCASTPSSRNKNIQEKWRKYVQQQFRTLKKNKRNRWLGRDKKSRRKPDVTSDYTAKDTSANRAGTSFENGLERDSSFDVLPPFELPPPDHKKRKKSRKWSSSSKSKKRRPTTTRKTTTSNTSTRQKKNKKKKSTPNQKSPAAQDGGETPVGITSQWQQEHEQQGNVVSPPKRPLNAFMLFSKACRTEFRSLMVPAFESKVVAMVLGHIWRYLTKDERQAFYQEAEENRRLYYEAQKEQRQREGERVEEDEEMLKKPVNGFMLYCREQRRLLHPKMTGYGGGRRLVRQMAHSWHRMKPSEKLVYMKRAEEESKQIHQRKTDTEGQAPLLPFGDGGQEESEVDGMQDTSGEGAARTKFLMKKMGKNNNKWFTDSSDTDGSKPSSATQVREASVVRTAPPSPLASGHANTSSRAEVHPTSVSAENEPRGSGTATGISEGLEGPSGNAVTTRDYQRQGISELVDSTVSESSDSCVVQKGKNKKGKKKRGKKRKSRVPRVSRQVGWKDDTQPWNVFDPVSSALCDEDILPRLYDMPRSRDDSWLYCGRRCCHFSEDNACLHSPGYSLRHCISCLSMDKLKKQMDMAFRKTEIELADLSSSTSSLCDMYPVTSLPDIVSSSSSDSCLHHLDRFHLSGHGMRNVLPLQPNMKGSLSCQHSHSQCYVSSCCDAKAKTPSSAAPVIHSEAPLTKQSVGLKNTAQDTIEKHAISSHRHKVQKSSSISVKQHPGIKQQNESKKDESHYFNSQKGKHVTQTGKAVKRATQKTCVKYLGSTQSKRNKKSKQPETSHSSTCQDCKKISEIIALAVTKNEHSQSLETRDEFNAVQEGTVNEFATEAAANIMQIKQTQRTKLASTKRNIPENVLNPESLTPENESAYTYKVGLEMDVTRLANSATRRYQQQTFSSRCVATTTSDEGHSDSSSDDDQSPGSKVNKMPVSASTQATVTVSESVTMQSSNKYLKRKCPHNSMEAVTSSNKVSVSIQTTCSLPKYPLLDKAITQSDAEAVNDSEENMSDNLLNSKSVTSESESDHTPKLGLEMDVTQPAGNASLGYQQHTFSSHCVATMTSHEALIDNFSDDDQSPGCKQSKMSVSTSTHAMVSKSEFVMQSSDEFLKFPQNVMEAVTSSSKVSVSIQTTGSLPKYLLSLDEVITQSNTVAVNDNEKNMSENLLISKSVAPESESDHTPKLGLEMDVTQPVGNASLGYQQHTFSSHCVATMTSNEALSDNSSDDDQSPDGKPSMMSVSTSTRAMVTKSESVISQSASKCFKRTFSYNSMEAMTGSNQLSVSNKSACSLLKCPPFLDEAHRTKLSGGRYKLTENVTRARYNARIDVKRPSYHSVTVYNQMPEDLELEYFRINRMI